MLQLFSSRVRRPISLVGIAFVFSTLALYILAPYTVQHGSSETPKQPWTTSRISQPPSNQTTTVSQTANQKIHILLPATRSNINFCKTLLTMILLGYPSPTIIAWADQDRASGLLGGGSHFAKITRTLDYINDPKRRNLPGFDDELVMMLDAYDIWFQLPLDVLLSRYNAILEDDAARVSQRMGRAYTIEGINSRVVFGAGKRCAPNLLNSVACYPVPESPLPNDLYGGNTDTFIGTSQWSSYRTRYLNSGYIIGPVGENRKGASDQSIFVEMFGEQEYYREVMRRHHRTRVDDVLDRVVPGRAGSRPPPTVVQQVPVLDRLEPAFTHQQYNKTHLPDKPYEFGIALDYWSLLGHQTSNAVTDARYIRHSLPVKQQMGKTGKFDCVPKTEMMSLPNDLPSDKPLPWMRGMMPDMWATMPLYTEICIGTVPVMIHHNSVEKYQRERQWSQTWWYRRAKPLFEERRKEGIAQLAEGIPTDRGTMEKWEMICPKFLEKELFRNEKGN
ncbi:uncharacterized protein T069G_10395 [Trichoderma breve]|uniref:Uncharacterized protein n=1 Tax=Trichoderma breve TaxID=2034170 RepID=A0A9W9B3K0_9HYPO|nr:uncharacterized protein T069G_10395 [Trichoderma breve]KAJ4854837.1 hypothetical protein T069G_10395 [Trichoderma breve]